MWRDKAQIGQILCDSMALEIRQPELLDEWEKYYDLRWRVLRASWSQPRGSEQDEFEREAYHLMALEEGKVLSVGRIHLIAPRIAQVRYMATAFDARGKGLGTRILQGLETYAREVQVIAIFLNA